MRNSQGGRRENDPSHVSWRASEKMKLLFAITLMALCSCANISKVSSNNVEPEFKDVYNQFVLDSQTHGRDISKSSVTISRGDTSKICLTRNPLDFDPPEACCFGGQVIIQSGYIFQSQEQMKAILYHELGHCLLNKVHDWRISRDGSAYSLMTPFISDLSLDQFNANKDHYINQLFSHENE